MKVANQVRSWLESTKHLPDHASAHLTMGEAREWARRVAVLDDVDRICASVIERESQPGRGDR